MQPKRRIIMICLYCDKEFEISASHYFERESRGKFCSRVHWVLGARYSKEEFRKTKEPVDMSPQARARPRPMILVICQTCGISFEIGTSKLKLGWGKFCSKKCSGFALRKRVNVTCENCGVKFERTLFHYLHDGKHKYCSPKCRIKGRIIIHQTVESP